MDRWTTIATAVDGIFGGIGSAVKAAFSPPDFRDRNTANGAYLAVRGAVAAYRLTKDPEITALTAIVLGAVGAYYGAQMDNEYEEHFFPRHRHITEDDFIEPDDYYY